MNTIRFLCGGMLGASLLVATAATETGCKPGDKSPEGYNHTLYAPETDICREFPGFVVSFDSKDDDDGKPGQDLLRVPHWVAQEVRAWEPAVEDQDDDAAWCLDTLKRRPRRWFTDRDLFATGVAPNDASYRGSGFDRGHMAMKLLVERLGQDAAYSTHTVLNAIPQRPKFNQGIWKDLELLTGAWAQEYGKIWVIQGPVFYKGQTLAWIGDEGERKVAVPDAAFKIVVRKKNSAEEKANAPDRDKDALEVLAFLYPQLGPGYFGPSKDYRHARFLTSVDEIEDLTGLDFNLSRNSDMDDLSWNSDIEKRVERRRATALWKPAKVDRKQRRQFISGCRS